MLNQNKSKHPDTLDDDGDPTPQSEFEKTIVNFSDMGLDPLLEMDEGETIRDYMGRLDDDE